ncbi:MAG: toxic anion resistance protein [Lachnospiraceae bacterium]|nr:toxic anion resistance protein [Lachnospiraceae bacterium]
MADEMDVMKTEVPSLDFGAAPAAPAIDLTFGAAPEAPAPAAAAAAKPAEEKPEEILPTVTDEMLTDAEKERVEAFSKMIDVNDSAAVLQYGAGAQKKMVDFSEKALENVRTKDMGEVGDMIAGLVTELRHFDGEEEESKGFFGFFKKQSDKATTMKAKYDKVEVNVDRISKSLENHQVQLIKDIAMLDQMYTLNLAYFKELTMYILAGKKRLQEVRAVDLKALQDKALKSGLAEDAQAAKDLDEKCLRFEKKLYDLELTRTVALQTAPQIRLVQDSDEVMVEKIQSTLVNTIPLWKNQMVIALGVQHSNEAARAQSAVTDLTNDLLKANADKLKMATVQTAQASERGIVDIETLKSTNATLMSTLDEVVKIQADGRAKRQAAEAEMKQMEDQLKAKLLEMSQR